MNFMYLIILSLLFSFASCSDSETSANGSIETLTEDPKNDEDFGEEGDGDKTDDKTKEEKEGEENSGDLGGDSSKGGNSSLKYAHQFSFRESEIYGDDIVEDADKLFQCTRWASGSEVVSYVRKMHAAFTSDDFPGSEDLSSEEIEKLHEIYDSARAAHGEKYKDDCQSENLEQYFGLLSCIKCENATEGKCMEDEDSKSDIFNFAFYCK